MSCRGCERVFRARRPLPEPPHAAAVRSPPAPVPTYRGPGAPLEPPPPAPAREGAAPELPLSVRGGRPRHLLYLAGAPLLFWLGYSLVTQQRLVWFPRLKPLPLGLVFLAVAALFAYTAVAGLLSTVRLEARRSGLRVQRGPLPEWDPLGASLGTLPRELELRFASGEVREVFVRRFREVFELCVRTDKTVTVVAYELPRAEGALAMAEALEAHLAKSGCLAPRPEAQVRVAPSSASPPALPEHEEAEKPKPSGRRRR